MTVNLDSYVTSLTLAAPSGASLPVSAPDTAAPPFITFRVPRNAPRGAGDALYLVPNRSVPFSLFCPQAHVLPDGSSEPSPIDEINAAIVPAVVLENVSATFVAGTSLHVTLETVSSITVAVNVTFRYEHPSSNAPPSMPGDASTAAAPTAAEIAADATVAFTNRTFAVYVLHVECGLFMPPTIITCGAGSYGTQVVSSCSRPADPQPVCGYFDTNTRSWSSAGCIVVDVTDSYMDCACSHLTDFAARFSALGAAQVGIFAETLTLGEANRFAAAPFILAVVVVIAGIIVVLMGLTAAADVASARRFYRALASDGEVRFLRRLELLKGRTFILDRVLDDDRFLGPLLKDSAGDGSKTHAALDDVDKPKRTSTALQARASWLKRMTGYDVYGRAPFDVIAASDAFAGQHEKVGVSATRTSCCELLCPLQRRHESMAHGAQLAKPRGTATMDADNPFVVNPMLASVAVAEASRIAAQHVSPQYSARSGASLGGDARSLPARSKALFAALRALRSRNSQQTSSLQQQSMLSDSDIGDPNNADARAERDLVAAEEDVVDAAMRAGSEDPAAAALYIDFVRRFERNRLSADAAPDVVARLPFDTQSRILTATSQQQPARRRVRVRAAVTAVRGEANSLATVDADTSDAALRDAVHAASGAGAASGERARAEALTTLTRVARALRLLRSAPRSCCTRMWRLRGFMARLWCSRLYYEHTCASAFTRFDPVYSRPSRLLILACAVLSDLWVTAFWYVL